MTTPTPLRLMEDPTDVHVMPSRLTAAQRAAETALMPPPASRLKRHRPAQTVLSEESYTEKLNAIIERDFFPDLPKMRDQLEWLTALERGDVTAIGAIQRRVATSVRRSDRAYASVTPTPLPSASMEPVRFVDHARSLSALDLAGSQHVHLLASHTPLRQDGGSGASSQLELVGGKPSDESDNASLVSWSAGIGAGVGVDGSGSVAMSTCTASKRRRTDSSSVRAPGGRMAMDPEEAAHVAAQTSSLDAFQQRFTSEDNASFEVNQTAKVEEARRRHWWLYEHADSLKYKYMLTDGHAGRAVLPGRLRDDNILGVRVLDDVLLGGDPHGQVRTWRHRPMNAVFFQPELAYSNSICRVEHPEANPDLRVSSTGKAGSGQLTDQVGLPLLADRHAAGTRGATSGQHEHVSALPHAFSSAVVSVSGMDILLPSGHRLNPHTGGVRAPATTRIGGTRLSGSEYEEVRRLRSAAAEVAPPSTAQAVLDAAILAGSIAAASPRINGYGFVTTPLVEAGAVAPTLDETTALLGLSSTGAGTHVSSSFRIAPDSKREAVASRMTERMSPKIPHVMKAVPLFTSHAGRTGTHTGARARESEVGGTSTRRPAFAATPTPFHIGEGGSVRHAIRAGPGPGSVAPTIVSTGSRRSTGSRSAHLSPAARAIARVVAQEQRAAQGGAGGSRGSGEASITDLAGTGLRAGYRG